MGASRWIYFSDNSPDPQVALDELREQVFQRHWRQQEPSLETVADLMESDIMEEEGGTHSIIDVERVAKSKSIEYEEDGTVRLVSPEEMCGYFGVEKPTRDLIERVYRESASEMPPMFRGSGCCAPFCNERGEAVGFVFWGMTGG